MTSSLTFREDSSQTVPVSAFTLVRSAESDRSCFCLQACREAPSHTWPFPPFKHVGELRVKHVSAVRHVGKLRVTEACSSFPACREAPSHTGPGSGKEQDLNCTEFALLYLFANEMTGTVCTHACFPLLLPGVSITHACSVGGQVLYLRVQVASWTERTCCAHKLTF